jgi:hypothetical protein
LLGIVGAIAICWVLGGIAGIGLAALSSEFFRTTFVPRGFGMGDSELPAFAWVGGSIWGAQFGGLASLIVGLVVLRAHWHRISASPDVSHHKIPSHPNQPPTAG